MFKLKPKSKDGIYYFPIEDSTTNSVADFYDVTPFPSYELNDDKLSIMQKGDRNQLTKKLKDFIGLNKSFIEFGSGTSQLSNYLAIGTNNKIFAFDPTEKSLRLGYDFAKKNGIKNVSYINADIFDDVLEEKSFDFVWCSGVLHHTKDPYGGFAIIQKSLKSNGYIFIGLYNKYGRFRTFLRQILYKFFGARLIMIMDPYLRSLDKRTAQSKIDAWIQDQYQHPEEQSHSFDEVLNWFDGHNIEFINSIPSIDLLDKSVSFKKNATGTGNFLSRLFIQIKMIFSKLGQEGGLFLMVGQKKS
jgi:SAM-dependent methyltransferase